MFIVFTFVNYVLSPVIPSPCMCCRRIANAITLIPKPYLEGQGDVGSRLITGIFGLIIWLIGVINLLPKSS